MEAKKRGVVVRNVVKTGLPKRGALRYPPAMDAAGRGADSSGVSVTGTPVGAGAAWWREWPTGFEDIDDDHRLVQFAREMSGGEPPEE